MKPQFNMPRDEKIHDSEVAITLLNMGGPQTAGDIPGFQRRLFSDPLLIRFPVSWMFQGLFARALTVVRAKKTAERYRLIGGGSPIFDSTKKQARFLQKELARRGRTLDVTFTFNYSDPLPDQTIHQIRNAGKKYILPVSLYPHYSRATTGSSVHYLQRSAKKYFSRALFLPAPEYYVHAGYIQAFKDRILETLRSTETLDDFYLLFSAHAIPFYLVKEGDPYSFQVEQTVLSIVKALGRKDGWSLAYQSAMGPIRWTAPSIKDELMRLAQNHVRKIIVIPVSFVSDHIETLWEIDIQFRSMASNLGIHDFRMSKAIECHSGFITALADTVEQSFGKEV